jgi:hypothetical protein
MQKTSANESAVRQPRANGQTYFACCCARLVFLFQRTKQSDRDCFGGSQFRWPDLEWRSGHRSSQPIQPIHLPDHHYWPNVCARSTIFTVGDGQTWKTVDGQTLPPARTIPSIMSTLLHRLPVFLTPPVSQVVWRPAIKPIHAAVNRLEITSLRSNSRRGPSVAHTSQT